MSAGEDPDRPSLEEWKASGPSGRRTRRTRSKHAKMAAVDNVIAMLRDVQSQVLQEGEQGATTCNKSAC